MKLAVLLIFLSTSLYAQQYKRLRVGIGLGWGNVIANYNYSGSNIQRSEGPVLISLEPSYRFNDRIRVGVRLEAVGQLIGGGQNITSYGINGQYYFLKKRFRPFVGMGLSFFHPRLVGDGFYSFNSELEETLLGFYPRIGFDFGHLFMIVEKNIVNNANAKIYPPGQIQLPAKDGTLSSNYFSLKIGIFIGGGRKK